MKNIVYIAITSIFALSTLPAYTKEYEVFDIVGDSISAGVNAELESGEIYGWVNMLFGESHALYPAKTNTISTLWPDITYTNSAVSGSTASDWAGDFGGRLTTVKGRHPDLVVVFIGGNDLLAALQNDAVFSPAEQEQYRANLTTIITNLQDSVPVPDIMLVNYYDLFDGYSGNVPPLNPLYPYRDMSASTIIGNQIIRETAASNGCYLVDGVYDEFMHHGYGAELGDVGHLFPDYVRTPLAILDIHPVTAGHSKIYELIYEKLDYLKLYGIPEQWLAQYGLTNYYEDVAADQDSDSMPTWEEYIAGTDPTNAVSVFQLIGSPSVSPAGYILQWDAVSNRSYSAFYSTNLTNDFQLLEADLTASSYTDTVHQADEGIFYRMKVQKD